MRESILFALADQPMTPLAQPAKPAWNAASSPLVADDRVAMMAERDRTHWAGGALSRSRVDWMMDSAN